MTPTKRTVAITQRIDFIAERGETRDALDQRLVKWVVAAGYLPVAVPNSLLGSGSGHNQWLEEWLHAVQPAALVLSGGNDIGACPDRDATEGYLLTWAQSQSLPLLGICRGMQMMAFWAGVGLERAAGHAGTRHQLINLKEDRAWPNGVNSYHDWRIASCPEGFEVVARTEDGTIEAICHLSLPWEGWMWHPERENSFNELDVERLRALVTT